jgi:hypothetical protein
LSANLPLGRVEDEFGSKRGSKNGAGESIRFRRRDFCDGAGSAARRLTRYYGQYQKGPAAMQPQAAQPMGR